MHASHCRSSIRIEFSRDGQAAKTEIVKDLRLTGESLLQRAEVRRVPMKQYNRSKEDKLDHQHASYPHHPSLEGSCVHGDGDSNSLFFF